MRAHSFFLIFSLLLFSSSLKAQLEGVIVEKYYVSDASDASDTTGGGLEQGSVTYRVYIDLKEGSRLMKIYADQNHPISISSTAKFFNNTTFPGNNTFGYKINKSYLRLNTMALDTWLTMGFASKQHYGILKADDPDSSIIGGKYNDGGSAKIIDGLLTNNDPASGRFIREVDGLVQTANIPGISSYGLLDDQTDEDTATIFGNYNNLGRFFSTSMILLHNTGISGPTPDNRILVTQLTTRGDIAFKLNIEIDTSSETGINRLVKYVADDSVLLKDEILSPLLSYPLIQTCGCKDPEFLEFSSDFDCDNMDSCKTPIVYGCMDPMACNFNMNANFDVPELCCYPGNCQNRDLDEVCPTIKGTFSFNIFPNSVGNELNIQLSSDQPCTFHYTIYNSFGFALIMDEIESVSGTFTVPISTTDLPDGIYFIQIISAGESNTKKFVKN